MEEIVYLQAIIPLIVAGLAVAAGGAVGGAISRSKQKKAFNSGINRMKGENESWYNANALTDYTQRADAQNLLKNMRENLQRRQKASSATAAITGATPASVAAAKEQDARVVSDTYSNLGAMGQRWKDDVTNQYLKRRELLNLQQLGHNDAVYDRDAQGWGNLMNSGLNAASMGAGNYLNASATSANTAQKKPGSYGQYYQ